MNHITMQEPENTEERFNVMVDIETTGVRDDCAILAIGLVQFSTTTWQAIDKYEINIGLAGNFGFNRTSDGGTKKFWEGLDEGLRNRMLYPENVESLTQGIDHRQYLATDLNDAMRQVFRWLSTRVFDRIWCRGTDFDPVILNKALAQWAPWEFYQAQDLRTLTAIYKPDLPRDEVKFPKHNPVSDCLYQIETLRAWCEHFGTRPRPFEQVKYT